MQLDCAIAGVPVREFWTNTLRENMIALYAKRELDDERNLVVRELSFRMYDSAVGYGKGSPFNIRKATDLYRNRLDSLLNNDVKFDKERAEEAFERYKNILNNG